jgi:hypothetical protein
MEDPFATTTTAATEETTQPATTGPATTQPDNPDCAASNNNWKCCSGGNKCGHMEGDCDKNTDCLRGHFCGDNNCNNVAAVYGMDCCERVATTLAVTIGNYSTVVQMS